jgi:hypothetical protein
VINGDGMEKRFIVRDVIDRDCDDQPRMCSLCGVWGVEWVELDILGDSEVYCLECTGKGLHEIH